MHINFVAVLCTCAVVLHEDNFSVLVAYKQRRLMAILSL